MMSGTASPSRIADVLGQSSQLGSRVGLEISPDHACTT